MDDNWLTDWLTDLLIDDNTMITKFVIIPAVSGLYRPTGLLFKFQFKLHENVFLLVSDWDIKVDIVSGDGLVSSGITWNNVDQDPWCHIVSQGHNELTICWLNHMVPWWYNMSLIYRQTFDISRTLVRNDIVDHWDVAGVLPVGAAPTASSFSTGSQLTWFQWIRQTTARQDENHLSFVIWCTLY